MVGERILTNSVFLVYIFFRERSVFIPDPSSYSRLLPMENDGRREVFQVLSYILIQNVASVMDARPRERVNF